MGNRGKQSSIQKLVVDLYRMKWNNEELELRDILHKMYIVDKRTEASIRTELHIGAGTLSSWMKQCGITTRKMTWI